MSPWKYTLLTFALVLLPATELQAADSEDSIFPFHQLDFPQAMEKADSSIKESRFEDAIQYLNAALDANPGNVDAVNVYTKRCECNFSLQRRARAFHDAAMILSLDEKNAFALRVKGEILITRNQIKECRAPLQQAADLGDERAKSLLTWLGPENPRLDELLNQANDVLKHANGELDLHKALGMYETAASMNPNCPDTTFGRGKTFEKFGKFEDAIKDYTFTIANAPDWSEPYLRRGLLSMKLGRQGGADLTQALMNSDISDEERLTRARQSLEKGDFEKAIDDAQLALWASTDFADGYEISGMAYLKSGNVDAAISKFTEGIRYSDTFDHPRFYRLRAQAYEQAGRHSDAAADRAKVEHN
jgi:hypothetical protein